MSLPNDRELDLLRSDLESDRVERKRSAAERGKIRRNICAFANDLPAHDEPGVIFIGVEDDGRCANLEIGDRLLRTLADMRDDGNILPVPSFTVQKRFLSGCEVVALIVEPSRNPPVRYRGRVWIKVGPTVRQATPDEELRLSERRRAADRLFDSRPVRSASVEDLDLDRLKTGYLPLAVAPDVLQENRRPLGQQLHSLRLLVHDVPVWGAILGFGRDPQGWIPGAYVQFLRIDGRDITDPIRTQKTLTGRLQDVLRRSEELLDLAVSVRTEVAGHARESRRPDYPVDALRQFARNAIMHRNYEGTNAPVRIHWYDDRVEILSPGGLYGRVTPENLGTHITDYRNPLVAEIMHHTGFAQRFGLGIPLARQKLKANGNPEPEFDFRPVQVTVTVRPAP